MRYLELFLRESKNSRRGSDVPKGGESNGVARLKFPRSILEIPSRIWERRGEGRHQRYEKNLRRDSGSGVFISQRHLSVVPTRARYYRGFKEIELVSPYRYYQRRVGSTGGPRTPSGSTDRASVVPRCFEIPTVNSYRYFRPCVGSTVNLQDLEKKIKKLVEID
jgi:hypothetical protein